MLTEADLRILLSHLELPAASHEILVVRFGDCLELIRFGEPKIALENLCDNLFEFDLS